TTAASKWNLTVVSASTKLPPVPRGGVFGAIAFGHGEAPSAVIGGRGSGSAPSETRPPALSGNGVAELDKFETLATTGGYLPANDFLTFIHNAETGVHE